MSRSYIPRRQSNFSWYFCCGTFNLVLHTKAKRGSAFEYTQVCSRAFMSSISLRAISLGGGGVGLGGRGGNGMRLQSLCSAILMMHPCSTIPSRWLCINDLMNYSAISQVMFVLIWLFVVFALCANQKRGGLGQVRTTGVYHFNGHVEFSKFQTGNFWWMKSAQLLLPCVLLYPGLFPCRLWPKIPISLHTLAIATSCSYSDSHFFPFFRSHRSDTLPSRGCLLPLGSLETTASGIRPSRSGAENSFEC